VVTDFPAPEMIKRMGRHEKHSVKLKDDIFSELYMGFDLVESLAEAERCMTCGAKSVAAHLDDCMTCFACELNCPADAIFVHPFKEVLPQAFRPIETGENCRTVTEDLNDPQDIDITREKIGGSNVPKT
jgi:NAD-dependent dihydropyrimidine dehydrogenase PreA subunit